MLADEPPLTLAELDSALNAIGSFEPQPLIAVGVSGGPDSLALTILADRWARGRGGTAWGLVVDHRLRPESGAEAERVCGWLAARGIPHAVLVWRGDKPATGIQEAARAERYRLLAEWCAAHGCLHLFTAHHRDDQIETFLIRRRAKSGVDGLAGMSAVREMPGLRLVRPLLGLPKARLPAFLDAEGQPYLEDPSNRNPAFERSRLRLGLAAAPRPLPASGERKEPAPRAGKGEGQVLLDIRANAAARIARERELAVLLARAVALHPAGVAAIEPELLLARGALGEQALGRVAAVIGGALYPPRRERLARLCQGLEEHPMRARTLGGCRFVPWRGRVLALREPAHAAPPLWLSPGTSAVWDKRFAVSMPAIAPGRVRIGALGADGVARLGRHPVGGDNPLPRFVYPALPAVWDDDGLAAVPHLGWRRVTAQYPLELIFRPAVSLLQVGFTVV